MINHKLHLNDLRHLTQILSWYNQTFDRQCDYDIVLGSNPFLPQVSLNFLDNQEKTMFLLRFGANA